MEAGMYTSFHYTNSASAHWWLTIWVDTSRVKSQEQEVGLWSSFANTSTLPNLYLWARLLEMGPQCGSELTKDWTWTPLKTCRWVEYPQRNPLEMSKPQIEMAKPAANQKLTEHLGNREGCMRKAPGSNRGEGISVGDLHRRLSTLDFHSPEVKTLPQKFFPQQCLQSFTKAKSFTFYIPGVPRFLL